MQRGFVLVLSAVVGLPACFASAPELVGCRTNSDCEAGWVCGDDQTCVRLCESNDDCDGLGVCDVNGLCSPPGEVGSRCSVSSQCVDSAYCDIDGVCSPRSSGEAPAIDAVEGNGSAAEKIENGLVVRGTALDQAAFELASANDTQRLNALSRTATAVELQLPADIRSGEYTLVAVNAAGSDQSPVVLELPELTGDLLVGRINSEATNPFDVAVLPVGTGASEVAAGDHSHDVAYYTKAQIDANHYTRTAVDAAIDAARPSGECPAGHVVTGFGAGGSLLCRPAMVVVHAFDGGETLDDPAGETKSVLGVNIDLPGPGQVVAIGIADVSFMNSSTTNNRLGYVMTACRAPDVWEGGNGPDQTCGNGTYAAIYHKEEVSTENFEIAATTSRLDFGTGGTKTIYLTFSIPAGKALNVFRTRMTLIYSPD